MGQLTERGSQLLCRQKPFSSGSCSGGVPTTIIVSAYKNDILVVEFHDKTLIVLSVFLIKLEHIFAFGFEVRGFPNLFEIRFLGTVFALSLISLRRQMHGVVGVVVVVAIDGGERLQRLNRF